MITMKNNKNKSNLKPLRLKDHDMNLTKKDEILVSVLQKSCDGKINVSTRYGFFANNDVPENIPTISQAEADNLMCPVIRRDEDGNLYEEMVPCEKSAKITGRYGNKGSVPISDDRESEDLNRSWIELREVARMQNTEYALHRINEVLIELQNSVKKLSSNDDKKSLIVKVINTCMPDFNISINDKFISEVEKDGFMVRIDANDTNLIQLYQKLCDIKVK